MAHAGVLLALVIIAADHTAIRAAVDLHERLWGQTYLQDPAYLLPRAAWDSVKQTLLRKYGITV